MWGEHVSWLGQKKGSLLGNCNHLLELTHPWTVRAACWRDPQCQSTQRRGRKDLTQGGLENTMLCLEGGAFGVAAQRVDWVSARHACHRREDGWRLEEKQVAGTVGRPQVVLQTPQAVPGDGRRPCWPAEPQAS